MAARPCCWALCRFWHGTQWRIYCPLVTNLGPLATVLNTFILTILMTAVIVTAAQYLITNLLQAGFER